MCRGWLRESLHTCLRNGQGLLGGGQAGINIQRGAALFGIEGTYSAADIKGRHSYLTPEFTLADSFFGTCCDRFTPVSGRKTTTTRAKALANITEQLGFVSRPRDRTLFYVKGGAAYMRQDITNSHTTSYLYCRSLCSPDSSAN